MQGPSHTTARRVDRSDGGQNEFLDEAIRYDYADSSASGSASGGSVGAG